MSTVAVIVSAVALILFAALALVLLAADYQGRKPVDLDDELAIRPEHRGGVR